VKNSISLEKRKHRREREARRIEEARKEADAKAAHEMAAHTKELAEAYAKAAEAYAKAAADAKILNLDLLAAWLTIERIALGITAIVGIISALRFCRRRDSLGRTQSAVLKLRVDMGKMKTVIRTRYTTDRLTSHLEADGCDSAHSAGCTCVPGCDVRIVGRADCPTCVGSIRGEHCVRDPCRIRVVEVILPATDAAKAAGYVMRNGRLISEPAAAADAALSLARWLRVSAALMGVWCLLLAAATLVRLTEGSWGAAPSSRGGAGRGGAVVLAV